MFWKIYAFIFVGLGLLSIFTPGTHTPFGLVDMLLSVTAAIMLFGYAFRKRIGHFTLWKVLAVTYVVVNIVYNFIATEDVYKLHMLSLEWTFQYLVGLLILSPSYYMAIAYAWGRMPRLKSPVSHSSDKTPGQELPLQPTLGVAPRQARGLASGLWQALKSLHRNYQAVALIILATTCVSLLPSLFLLTDQSSPSSLLIAFLTQLISFVGSLVIASIALVTAIASASNKTISIGAASKVGLRRAWKLTLLYMLLGLLTAGGLLLFVIPGIIIAIRGALAPYIMFDQNVGPLMAFKLSNRLVKKNAAPILGLSTVVFLMTIPGFVLVLINPVIGGIVASVVGGLVALLNGTYLYWLYRDLWEIKTAGYEKLKTSWTSIVLVIIAGILGFMALLAYFIWLLVAGSHQRPQVHRTACYEVSLPDVYVVEEKSPCHLIARTQFMTFEYQPLEDDSLNVAGVAAHYKDRLFPPHRYSSTPLEPKPGEQALDGEYSQMYSLWDKQQNATPLVIFVRTMRPHVIEGKEVHAFVLTQIPNTKPSPQVDWRAFTSMFISIPETITWVPAGSEDYQAAIASTESAWTGREYSEAITHASIAISLAQTNYERSRAHSWRGLAKQESADTVGAEADYKLALELDKNNSQALASLGGIFYDRKEYASAMTYAERAVLIDPSFAEAYNLRALVHDVLGNRQAAIQDGRHAVELDSENQIYQNNLASYQTLSR